MPPVEHQGIRYQQGEHDDRQGDQAGGYLVAIDTETGERLWRLKVYDVPRQEAPGAPNFAIYFRSMALRPDGKSLEIENEAGSRFVVDLTERTVTQVSGPPTSAPPSDEPPLPDLPPPPEN